MYYVNPDRPCCRLSSLHRAPDGPSGRSGRPASRLGGSCRREKARHKYWVLALRGPQGGLAVAHGRRPQKSGVARLARDWAAVPEHGTDVPLAGRIV